MTIRSSYYNLKQGNHIDQADIRMHQEFVPLSQAMKLNALKTMSNRSSANQLLRLATGRESQGGFSSRAIGVSG